MLIQLPPRTVDLDAAVVLGGISDVALTPTETALLARLAQAAGAPVSRADLLTDVWGYAQTAQTRTVDTTVRRLRQKIEDVASDPRWLLTVYGQGYRLAITTPKAHNPRPASAPNPRTLATVVGRAQALAQVQQALSAGHLVTITGPAGMGKTRLAQAIGEAQPAWFVSLAEATTAAGFVRRVADTVGIVVEGEHIEQAAVNLGNALARRGPGVLVLDNLEQAVEAAALCVPHWRAAGLSILATSQVRLALEGEVVVRLASLTDAEGAALLLQRAHAQGHWRTRDAHDPALATLSRRLDGLPLALELAAARANLFSAEDLTARVDQALELLRHGRRDAPGRHGALRAALDWSWELLSADHQRALAWLSTVRGGIAPVQAMALLEAGGRSALDAEEALHTLVEHSLVHVVQEDPVRLGLYEVIRQYAADKLGARQVVARRAHRDVFLAIAEAAATRGDLATLGREVDNVLAQGPSEDPAGRIRGILALDLAFTANGPHHVHEALLEEAVTLSAHVPTGLRARALHAYAAMLVNRGALDRAEGALQAAERSASSSEARAQVLATRAERQLALGEVARASALAEEAQNLEVTERVRATLNLLQGEICQVTGHPLPAEGLCRRSAERAAAAGLPEREAAARTVLGNVLADLGRNEEALASHRAALATYRQLGAERREAAAQSNVANLLVALGEPAQAMEAYEEVLQIVRRRGQELDEAVALTNTGCALTVLGRTGEAEQALARSARIQQRAGVRRGQGIALGNLAIVRELAGRGEPADYSAALACLEGVDRRASLYFLAYRGGLRLERGEGGDDDIARAGELAVGMGDPAADQVIALCAARGGAGVAEALARSEGAGNADVHQARGLLSRLFQV